jgi:hypothetical protein
MLLRQSDINSRWLIVVFYPSSHETRLFLPMYLDRERGPSIVSTWYPNAITSCWVPVSFREVMVSLKNKLITCHYCHEVIFNAVWTMSLQDGDHTMSTNFPTKEDVNKHFIVVVIDKYLVTALQEFNNNQRKRTRLKRKVSAAKIKWNMKRDQRHQMEAYLGSLPFHHELRRSCEEVYIIPKKEWGFSPQKVFLMK